MLRPLAVNPLAISKICFTPDSLTNLSISLCLASSSKASLSFFRVSSNPFSESLSNISCEKGISVKIKGVVIYEIEKTQKMY